MTDDIDLMQNSSEWLVARAGSLGGSQIGKAIERLKRSGDRTQAAVDLMYEIAAERLTGVPAKRVNALAWGLEHQDEARHGYGLLTNLEVATVGLIRHPTIPGAHASPDALVGDEGGVEIKCPTSATHLKTLIEGVVPEDHMPQIMWNMACAKRAWWDFVSYDPRFPPKHQFFIRRVERDDAAIATLEGLAIGFLEDVDSKIAALEKRAA
jgi:putative phage-type endonuclease